MNNNQILRLTFRQEGARLLRRGKYDDAKVIIKNRFRKDESVNVLIPSKVRIAPVYGEALRILNLENAFITNSLSKPTNKWMRGKTKSEVRKWTGLTKTERLREHVRDLENDFGCLLVSMEIVE